MAENLTFHCVIEAATPSVGLKRDVANTYISFKSIELNRKSKKKKNQEKRSSPVP